jgi:hypothetical protein
MQALLVLLIIASACVEFSAGSGVRIGINGIGNHLCVRNTFLTSPSLSPNRSGGSNRVTYWRSHHVSYTTSHWRAYQKAYQNAYYYAFCRAFCRALYCCAFCCAFCRTFCRALYYCTFVRCGTYASSDLCPTCIRCSGGIFCTITFLFFHNTNNNAK